MSTAEKISKSMLHAAIYEELKRVARAGDKATYSEIAPLAGLDMGNAGR